MIQIPTVKQQAGYNLNGISGDIFAHFKTFAITTLLKLILPTALAFAIRFEKNFNNTHEGR